MAAIVMDSELKKRVMTGAAGASVIILLALLAGKFGLFLLAVVVSLGMVNEFVQIILNLPDKAEKRMVLLGTTWLIHVFALGLPRAEFELLIAGFIGLFSYFLFTARRHDGAAFSEHFRELMFSLFGLVYLAFLPLYLPMMSSGWALFFLFVVWMTDTGAYFAGKKWGKIKLYPLISPKKTREGALGGLVAAWLVALIFKLLFLRSMPWGAVFFVPLLVSPLSQVGDLCESFLKRAFDVKDSGSILPGHGGFLDRFDGVLFGLPMMYGCYKIFG